MGGGRDGMGGNRDFGNGQKPDFADGELPEGAFMGMGDMDGAMPEGTDYEAMDGIARAESSSSALSLSGTYETKQDYIDVLNASGEWVSWDEATNTVTITSVSAFTQALKTASKGIAAFDQLFRWTKAVLRCLS